MAKSKPNATVRTARILIVDDHPVVREGLSVQILAQPDLEVCGAAEDIAGALALVESAKPDVAIIDISLKSGNGLDLIKRIKARNKEVRILVWSMYPERLYAERALRAGALGYVNKSQATRQIIDGIRSALAGKVYLSEGFSEGLLGHLLVNRDKEAEGSPANLSDRELEVFGLMGQGLTTEQVAEKMHVSPKTVETYRARIKEKLGVRNITELIQQAAQWAMENT
jgi:DNA-binding NarL/FixJ family response regulator